MPYEWSGRRKSRKLEAWPYRSLPKRGFVLMIGATAALLSLPLLAVIGSKLLWGLLPFLLIALTALWWGLSRSYRDGEILEEMTIDDRMTVLRRHNPDGSEQSWESETYWVTPHLHPKQGPVENYLTLKGRAPRDAELGAFLTAEERATLYDELRAVLREARTAQ